MNKPFKGIIRDWTFLDGRVHGLVVWHMDDNIRRGSGLIYTSRVRRIYSVDGNRFCETDNSAYLLT